jgi:hypothetical protein
MGDKSALRANVKPARLNNPYRNLLDFGETTYQKELGRAVSLKGKRENRSEWGPRMQAQEAARRALVDAALSAAEKTGLPIEEVERRVTAFAEPVRAILLWRRDAPSLSSAEREQMELSGLWHDPATEYLINHYHRMQDAWQPVHVLAVRVEGSETESGQTSSGSELLSRGTGNRVAGESARGRTPQLDGPEGGCWLWWQGVRHDIAKGNVYKLVAFMWNRELASYDALVGPVFDSDMAPQTVRSYANKVNKDLKRIGIPWRLSTNSVTRHIIKKQSN